MGGGLLAAAIGAGCGGVCGNITITDGNVTANSISSVNSGGYPYSAAIGTSGEGSKCGDITISGGTVNAKCKNTASSPSYVGGAAGIGCGYISDITQTCGNITISGGEVTAEGIHFGSGIGTGYSRGGTVNMGNISITGGVVKAVGDGTTDDVGRGKTTNTPTLNIGTVTIDPSVTWNGTKGYSATATGYKRN